MLVIMPVSWTPPTDWEPADTDAYFPADQGPDGFVVEGAAIRAPSTLAPGQYTLAIGVAELNDVIGSPDKYVTAHIECTQPLNVTPQTISIEVEAVFGDPCRINVSLDPPA